MNATTQGPVDEQAELMTALLEGEDPDCYVVIPVGALVSQIQIAASETRDRKGIMHPGVTSARLIRNLGQLGWTRNTKHLKPDPAPHSLACRRERHAHGIGCSVECPSCGGVEQ